MDCEGDPVTRILWISNAPWCGSGYGEQTATFVPRLKALGHEMAVLCNFGVNEATIPWNGIPVYPTDNAWGNKSVGTWKERHQAELIITLADSFMMTPQEWPEDIRMAVWAPIDHDPLIPAAVLAVLSHEKIKPIAMSRFGEKVMGAANLDPLYVPHGIDTGVFYPRREIRDEVRNTLGFPRDAFLVGMVAANKSSAPSRKGFDPAFQAFAEFYKDHPDAWLYVHSQRNGIGAGMGEDLELLVEMTEILAGAKFSEHVRFPEQKVWDMGMSTGQVATLYQAFDVLLMPSMGEGFGIPLVEAQACGVPVITTNHSAMKELCQAGWLVSGQYFADKGAASYFMTPSVPSIVQALEAAYESRGDMGLREAAAEFAQQYDADLVTEQFWVPALEQLAPESRQVKRAKARRQAKVAA